MKPQYLQEIRKIINNATHQGLVCLEGDGSDIQGSQIKTDIYRNNVSGNIMYEQVIHGALCHNIAEETHEQKQANLKNRIKFPETLSYKGCISSGREEGGIIPSKIRGLLLDIFNALLKISCFRRQESRLRIIHQVCSRHDESGGRVLEDILHIHAFGFRILSFSSNLDAYYQKNMDRFIESLEKIYDLDFDDVDTQYDIFVPGLYKSRLRLPGRCAKDAVSLLGSFGDYCVRRGDITIGVKKVNVNTSSYLPVKQFDLAADIDFENAFKDRLFKVMTRMTTIYDEFLASSNKIEFKLSFGRDRKIDNHKNFLKKIAEKLSFTHIQSIYLKDTLEDAEDVLKDILDMICDNPLFKHPLSRPVVKITFCKNGRLSMPTFKVEVRAYNFAILQSSFYYNQDGEIFEIKSMHSSKSTKAARILNSFLKTIRAGRAFCFNGCEDQWNVVIPKMSLKAYILPARDLQEASDLLVALLGGSRYLIDTNCVCFNPVCEIQEYKDILQN